MTTAIPWWDVASTIFSKSIGIMGRAEAWKGRWGVFLDGYFTYVGASGSQVGASKEKTFGPVDFTLNKQIHLGGPRFNSINQYVRINLSEIKIANVPIDIGRFSLVGKHQTVKNGSLVIDYTKQYFEPFLGARLGLWLTPKFLVNLKGDVGGFGLVGDNHVDCNLEALLGYRVTKHIYAWAGYRAHGSWYDFGEDLVQINLAMWAHGPVLGMTYAF